jgi:hypothetical protein
MKFLKNNWKWIVTTIISIVALVPAYLVVNLNNKKSFSYDIQSISPLVSEEQTATPGIQVLFQGKEVVKPYVSVIKLINDGGIPIEARDFDGAIDIESGEGTNVLAASVIDKQPDSIRVNITNNDKKVSIMPTLLNPEDIVTIKVISGNAKPTFKISGRISGIKSFNKHGMKEQTRQILIIALFSTGALLFGITAAILMNAYSERDKTNNICLISVKALIFLAAPCFLGMEIVILLFQKKYALGDLYFFLIWIVAIFVGQLVCSVLKLHADKKLKFEQV